MQLADITEVVLEQLSFEQLRTFSQTSTISHAMVKSVLRLRYKSLVASYVDGNSAAFDKLMVASQAVISGSAAVWVLLSPCDWLPRDLNIVFPIGRILSFITYFTNIGYIMKAMPIDEGHGGTINSVTSLTRGGRIVTLLGSHNESIFPPIISTANTSQMNFMTPH